MSGLRKEEFDLTRKDMVARAGRRSRGYEEMAVITYERIKLENGRHDNEAETGIAPTGPIDAAAFGYEIEDEDAFRRVCANLNCCSGT